MESPIENQKIDLSNLQIINSHSLIPHLALENGFESNLIDDIANVNYTEDSKGFTCLKPLKGLPAFIDDLYFYKYLHKNEVDSLNESKKSTTPKKDSAGSNIVRQFTLITNEIFGEFCEQKIAFSVDLTSDKKEQSIIYQTLCNIRKRNNSAYEGYVKYYNCNNPKVLIKYKVNTSRVPIEKILKNLNLLEERLNYYGAGLMSIDYTRDFSGVLEKDRLESYLLSIPGFHHQNGETEVYTEDKLTFHKHFLVEKTKYDKTEKDIKRLILETNETCGRNTLKYIMTYRGITCVVKYYNKIVSNFEAGDVQKKIGTHLAEFAFCHSCEHLEKTFRHPDVVKRGMTRLELSIHGFDPSINYMDFLEEEFSIVKDAQIFHIQPGASQWLRLSKHITQCAMFSNIETCEISLFWFGSSMTKRLAGVSKTLKKKNIEANPKEWEHAKKWMILNFGFENVPIYDISLNVELVNEKRVNIIKKEIEIEEEPKRRKGRPTKQEEQERRSKMTEEEIKREDEKKEKQKQQRIEKKKRDLEKMERLKQNTIVEEKEKPKRKTKYETIEEEYNVQVHKLYITDFKYWLKKGPTFLTPFNKPSKMYITTDEEKKIKEPPCPKNEIHEYPSRILPETENIKWRFRIEPDHKRIGQKKLPKFPLQCFTNTTKKISTLTMRERNYKIYNEKDNEIAKQWIKDKQKETREKLELNAENKKRISENLKEMKSIALYEERKKTIDEIFHCFTNPDEIVDVLKENEYIDIFAFKEYTHCLRLAYKTGNDIKVCFANPLLTHIIKSLKNTCFNQLTKEETKYKPEYPVYFMPYESLKAKGKDGNDLKIIDEIDGKDIKIFNEILEEYYKNWEELRRLELPKLEEIFEEKVKPKAAKDVNPGEYEAFKYLKRLFRGKEQTILYIKTENEKEEPINGYWLEEELKKIELEKTIAPLYIRLGGKQNNPETKKMDRIVTIVSTQTE